MSILLPCFYQEKAKHSWAELKLSNEGQGEYGGRSHSAVSRDDPVYSAAACDIVGRSAAGGCAVPQLRRVSFPAAGQRRRDSARERIGARCRVGGTDWGSLGELQSSQSCASVYPSPSVLVLHPGCGHHVWARNGLYRRLRCYDGVGANGRSLCTTSYTTGGRRVRRTYRVDSWSTDSWQQDQPGTTRRDRQVRQELVRTERSGAAWDRPIHELLCGLVTERTRDPALLALVLGNRRDLRHGAYGGAHRPSSVWFAESYAASMGLAAKHVICAWGSLGNLGPNFLSEGKMRSLFEQLDPRNRIMWMFLVSTIVITRGSIAEEILVVLSMFPVWVMGKRAKTMLEASLKMIPFMAFLYATQLVTTFLSQGGVNQGSFIKALGDVMKFYVMASSAIFLFETTDAAEISLAIRSFKLGVKRLQAIRQSKILRVLEGWNKLVEVFAFIMGTSFQLVPMMKAEIQQVIMVQRARGAGIEGNKIEQLRRLARITTPLFSRSLEMVKATIMALLNFCYSPLVPRTSFRFLKFTQKDWLALVLMLFTIAVLVFSSLSQGA